MTRFLVTSDHAGIPTTQVPLPFLPKLAQCFPPDKLVTAYIHASSQVRVNFPGCDPTSVQKILDELLATLSSTSEILGAWPGLNTPSHDIHKAFGLHHPAPRRSSKSPKKHALPPATPAETIDQINAYMQNLTPRQQSQLTSLITHLKSSLADERYCFHQLFESAPDGYVCTNFDGIIQHANNSLYQLLLTQRPLLNSRPLFAFFTPSSDALILQRLRLLRTGISEQEPFTDLHAHLLRPNNHHLPVSIRLIAIHSPTPALSTLRWLIRPLP